LTPQAGHLGLDHKRAVGFLKHAQVVEVVAYRPDRLNPGVSMVQANAGDHVTLAQRQAALAPGGHESGVELDTAGADIPLKVQHVGQRKVGKDPSTHHIGGHVIEFDDPDHAHGVVYSKNEHETGDEWVIMQMMYVDDYVRQDGRWYFARRLPLYWYATDLNKPPIGDNKMRWPGTDWVEGNFQKLFPSYAEFWAREGDHGGPVQEPAPFDKFLETMRRGAAPPKVKVRAD
jgi:hypothetical protein